MWKYLVINGLWFSLLFLVHFFGSRKDQRMILVSILVAAGWFAFQGMMDPTAWIYYVVFSYLTFYGSASFRQWSYAEVARLKEEVRVGGKDLAEEQERLSQRSGHTRFLERKADEIVEFYEQIKEMSKSLDTLETFLIFSEALSEYFEFSLVKLSIFGEKAQETPHPEEVYELKGQDLRGVFDRTAYMNDPKRTKGEVFPFDQKIYQLIAERGQVIPLAESRSLLGDSPEAFTAYPIYVHDRLFAVLTLIGIKTQDDPLFFILIDRFISEMQRVRLYDRVETLAITDGLTGVYVRRHLMERLEGEADRCKRFALKLSFLMLDIDHFKRFNDEYGHLAGDAVLRNVAQTVKKSVREVDFVGRYGGEEFAVGLIETDETTALQVAERIRRSLEEKEFRAYGERLKVTISIGCATYSSKLNSVRQMVEAADAALYQAKRLGRNRVCSSN